MSSVRDQGSEPVGSVTRIEFPSFSDERGILTAIESRQLPFPILRVFVLSDLRIQEERGGHANVDTQAIVLIGGSMSIRTHNGVGELEFDLSSPGQGLVLMPPIWRVIRPLSDKTSCLVVSSEPHAESNYIRDFTEFRSIATKSR